MNQIHVELFCFGFTQRQLASSSRRLQESEANTVVFKMVRPSRVTDQVDVDEIGQLSLVTPWVDE